MVGGLVIGDLPSAFSFGAGALVGIFVSPDQDVDSGNISNTLIRNRLGAWAERGWSVLWYFYRRSIKHGSELSHLPILSTLARIAYLYFFFIVIPYVIFGLVIPGAWSIGTELRWWNSRIIEHFRIIVGLAGSDLIHYFLDLLTSEHAKQKKKEIFGLPLASSSCK